MTLSCNILFETNNFDLSVVLLSCLVSELQKPPSPGLDLRILSEFWPFGNLFLYQVISIPSSEKLVHPNIHTHIPTMYPYDGLYSIRNSASPTRQASWRSAHAHTRKLTISILLYIKLKLWVCVCVYVCSLTAPETINRFAPNLENVEKSKLQVVQNENFRRRFVVSGA
jgi:hypothetical protein